MYVITAAGISLSLAALAVAAPHEAFAGSAKCGESDMSFLITVNRLGSLHPDEFNDPCRSGSGPYNDQFHETFELTRRAVGRAYFAGMGEQGVLEINEYELIGTVADIPPRGWNRQQHMRYKYEFEGENMESHINIDIIRYTDIIDKQKKIALYRKGERCKALNIDWRVMGKS